MTLSVLVVFDFIMILFADDDVGGDDDVVGSGSDVGGPNLPCDLWG